MQLKLSKRPKASLLTVVLVLSIAFLGFAIHPAHASTYVGFTATQANAASCSASLCVPQVGDASATNGFGEILQAPFTGSLVAAGLETGSSTPNQIVILSFPPGTTPAVSAYPGGFCNGTCYTTNTGQSFTVVDVETVVGMTTNAFNTINLANPPATVNGQWFAIVWMLTSGGSVYTMGACGGASATCSSFGSGVAAIGFTFGVTNPSGSFSSKCLPNSCGGPFVENPVTTGASFNPAGTSGPTVTVTQCYGNCGTPAITLVNTNSTHTINFNQSITLFYEFQSNINGFVLNITTNVATTYKAPQPTSFGQSLGFYAVPNGCPSGQIPFTPACPGFKQFGSFTPVNTVKGLYSQAVTNGAYAVFNGEWLGVSISASLNGFDVNDTNTQVPIFQSNGNNPSTLSQTSSFNTLSKIGIWAWIVGNVVTGAGPNTPSGSCVGFGLDCLLTNAVNSFCTVVTAACQNGSSMFWIVILTLISIMAFVYIIAQILPTVSIARMGVGELSLLIFLAWVVIFTSLSLLSVWVMILVFLAEAILFGKKMSGYI